MGCALAILAALSTAGTASADFWGGVNVPDWSGNAHYTNQTWTFANPIGIASSTLTADLDNDGDADTSLIMPPVPADAGYVNPNSAIYPGVPAISYPGMLNTTYGDSFAWDWIDEGPMGQDWGGLQGMIGGMGQGSIDLYVPIVDVAGTTDVWVQYISYISNGSSGADVDAQFASDFDLVNFGIANLVGTQTSKSYEQIAALDGQGSTGDWWLITEQWEVDDAGDLLFLRINADVPVAANMIDSVQVVTSAVPEPATIGLLAIGGLAVLKSRRNR
jgi:hypothetical protein